jgi:hypothetical protein
MIYTDEKMDSKKLLIYVVVVIIIVVLLYFLTRSPEKPLVLDGAYIDLADNSEVLIVSKGEVVSIVKADGLKNFRQQKNMLGSYKIIKKGGDLFLMDEDVCVMALKKDDDFEVKPQE